MPYSLKNLQDWYDQWQAGDRSKNEIERTELNNPQAHGKVISRLWREHLGYETEDVHPMARKLQDIEAILSNQRLSDSGMLRRIQAVIDR